MCSKITPGGAKGSSDLSRLRARQMPCIRCAILLQPLIFCVGACTQQCSGIMPGSLLVGFRGPDMGCRAQTRVGLRQKAIVLQVDRFPSSREAEAATSRALWPRGRDGSWAWRGVRGVTSPTGRPVRDVPRGACLGPGGGVCGSSCELAQQLWVLG